MTTLLRHKLPEEYHYSTIHQWACIDENLVTIGLTEFALNKLGEVLYIDLPEAGDRVFQMETFGLTESVRNNQDLFSPVSGIVTEVNDGLLENPGLLNDDPYGEGWIIRVELENEKDLADLIRSPEYLKLISNLE